MDESNTRVDEGEFQNTLLSDLAGDLELVKKVVLFLYSRAQNDDAKLMPFVDKVHKSLIARDELDSGRAFASLFKELLHVIDRLRDQGDTDFSEELLEILGAHGLSQIEASGIANPSLHEITGVEKASTDVEVGEILRVVRSGYLLGGTVLRPAKVIIAQ